MQRGPGQEERAPEAVERFVKQLLVAYKAAKLYPPTSDIPRESANDLLGMLRGLLRDRSDLRLQVSKDGFTHSALPVLPGQRPFEAFAREFYNRGLADVRFHSSVTPKQLIDFLRVLQEQPEVLQSSGGFEQRLWDLQVDGVTVSVVSAHIVDTELTEEGVPAAPPDEEWPPAFDRIDDLVEAAYGARPRDQRMLVRFVQNPKLVARYLEELSSTGRGGRPLVNLIAGRVVSMAHVAFGELAEDQPALFRSLAEGLLSLDPDTRRDVLVQRLLPEARLDEGVAGVLRQFELSELCNALVEGLSPDPVSRDGLSRAIRNLAVISLRPREDVLGAAEAAMRENGTDDETIAAVLENAAPSRIQVAKERDDRSETVESVLRLVDLAPVAAEAVDEGVTEIRAEVADGISDGDIMLAVVTLVSLERRADMFGSLMAIMEDGIGLLLEWGEFEDAADAASVLAQLQADETLDEAQRERAGNALVTMADTRHVRELAAALRRHAPGTPEHESCRRLMTTLGAHTVGPLLEVLADEPDMAVRKSLMDLIASTAARQVASLGERTSDPRWYFVRNVVGLLGSTRSAEALPYLARTLRHSDARVRRETIRAVSNIRDRLSEEMLAAALGDDDAQNVGLAARLLGASGSRGAVAALAMAARGEGRGNRDPGVRVEAMEALGRLGGPDAEAALQDILRQRTLIRTGRSRELRTAAEAALAEIQRGRQTGGA